MALLFDIGDLNAVINRASFHFYTLFVNSYLLGAVYLKYGSEVINFKKNPINFFIIYLNS